ncbi:rnase h protein [Fusarium langsethiae]|uniref:Ribonuclease H n=1 Tax=Fusarium langsethiae TaxID=179993 RepID=A0A0N0V7G8_FUSLA|nr:rnase h protein [Fusarium langsethiae]GKU01770.1 unnamed protein product [Fusarium langsethiae]GKU16574.1 unnamed protein product [Fusarium langsethiae]
MKRNATSGGFGGSPVPKKKKGKKNFYVVKVGRSPGIYNTWHECSTQVTGFPGAEYAGFVTAEEAQDYMGGTKTSAPTASASKASIRTASTAKANGPTKYYAVAVGSKPGIYNTWVEASPCIQGAPGAKHKKFDTLEGAENFIRQFGTPETCQGLGIAPSPGPQARQSSQGLPPGQYESAAEQVRAQRDLRKKQHAQKIQHEQQAQQAQRTYACAGAESDGDTIKIYTDGSSLGNGKAGCRAGLGVFFGHDDERNHAERLPGLPQTNQRAELLAVLRAMEIAPLKQGIEIVTDSKYSINCATEWAKNWEKNNWRSSQGKAVMNQDIIRDIRAKMKEREAAGAVTEFKWVKGHASDPGNHEADRLANVGSRMPEVV